jgi:hypothetical protein
VVKESLHSVHVSKGYYEKMASELVDKLKSGSKLATQYLDGACNYGRQQ